MIENYLDQNNKVAQMMLERIYYKPFQEGKKDLEIFLTGHCSAQCKYCYLHKYSNELYPLKYSSEEEILNNLQLILNWYIKNCFKSNISIFSAEWLDKNTFREKVFDIIYKTFKNKEYKPLAIVIPSNLQFINDDEAINSIQNWINIFNNELNIKILISGSIDGKYCDEDRTSATEEFYNKCRDFFVTNHFLFHPMVSSYNAKYWVDNYKWWREFFPKEQSQSLMMLEVRDETWDDQSILDFLTFLNSQIDYQFKYDFHEDIKEFARYILRLPNKFMSSFPNYHNLTLMQSNDIYGNHDTINCSVNDNCLVIRAGDLAVLGCHRQGYEELELGNFIIENNEISHFNVKRLELFIAFCHLKKSCFSHCESCEYAVMCPGFCLGNSYENYKNSFIPVKEVCRLYQSKFDFLINKYYNMGIFNHLDDFKNELAPGYYNYLVSILNKKIIINEEG